MQIHDVICNYTVTVICMHSFPEYNVCWDEKAPESGCQEKQRKFQNYYRCLTVNIGDSCGTEGPQVLTKIGDIWVTHVCK